MGKWMNSNNRHEVTNLLPKYVKDVRLMEKRKFHTGDPGTGRSTGHPYWMVQYYFGWKACINIYKHTLKFSNSVLVRVPINNNNYEYLIVLSVMDLAETPPRWCTSI